MPSQCARSVEGLVNYIGEMAQRPRYEAIIFITNDSDPAQPHCVPHSAFDDPSCPKGVPRRASIEMRGIAYWFR
jgi:hypothetical protein